MNREEYLKRLSFLLKDLPKEEIEDAIAYYEDYFEEAGEEKEEQVIKKLGSPEKIAKMIRDSVQENQASSEYTEEGYRQETYEDYQQMSRKDSQKEAKQGSRWHMKGRRNRNIILMILILVFVGSWLIPGIFGIVIGIAGGTGSGKSTFTNRLKDRFGDDIDVIYHDNYYRRQDDVPMEVRQKRNYDHPDALETDLLVEHLKQLKAGHAVDGPVYDYTMHNRSEKTMHIEPRRIIIVEGILLLADRRLRDMFDIKIYVEADADERILRRIVRDVEERGRSLENIVEQYLTTVKPMHYLYVEPTRAKADLVINSGLNDVAFDIMATKIQKLLEEV